MYRVARPAAFLIGIVVIGGACTSRPTTRPGGASSPSWTASAVPAPSPSDTGAAAGVTTARVYEDLYAGFRLVPPEGWVQYAFSGLYSFAPSRSELAAYPDFADAWGSPGTFTVMVTATQRETFQQVVDRVRKEEDSEALGESEREIAGRRASVLMRRWTVGCDCVDSHTIVPWTDETVIEILSHAGNQRAFDRYATAASSMVSSLSTGDVDPRAGALRAFLRARIAGLGAEEWLSSRAAASYRRIGLYAIEHGPGDLRVDGYTVEAVEPASDSTTFEVAVWGTPSGGGPGAGRERITIGAGLDRSGSRRAAVVLDAMQIQPPYTS